MTYLLKSKPKHQYRGRILLVIGVFIFLSLTVFVFPNAVRSLFQGISRPLWGTSNTISSKFSFFTDFFTSRSALIKKNLDLENELLSLKLKEADYQLISKENLDLKLLLDRVESGDRVPSKVLSRPPRSPYDTMVLDVGENKGIITGDMVYISQNFIIGIIKSVTSHSSVVELFSTGGRRQEAILERTGVSFELVGKGGANLEVEVPKDTDVLWGDVFMYPTSLHAAIGSVYYIESDPQSSFKKIHIRLPENAFQTKWVFVSH